MDKDNQDFRSSLSAAAQVEEGAEHNLAEGIDFAAAADTASDFDGMPEMEVEPWASGRNIASDYKIPLGSFLGGCGQGWKPVILPMALCCTLISALNDTVAIRVGTSARIRR